MEKKNGIMDLKWGMCRYILNKDMSRPEYCCEPVTLRAYCEKHAKMCYLPLKKNDLLMRTE